MLSLFFFFSYTHAACVKVRTTSHAQRAIRRHVLLSHKRKKYKNRNATQTEEQPRIRVISFFPFACFNLRFDYLKRTSHNQRITMQGTHHLGEYKKTNRDQFFKRSYKKNIIAHGNIDSRPVALSSTGACAVASCDCRSAAATTTSQTAQYLTTNKTFKKQCLFYFSVNLRTNKKTTSSSLHGPVDACTAQFVHRKRTRRHAMSTHAAHYAFCRERQQTSTLQRYDSQNRRRATVWRT